MSNGNLPKRVVAHKIEGQATVYYFEGTHGFADLGTPGTQEFSELYDHLLAEREGRSTPGPPGRQTPIVNWHPDPAGLRRALANAQLDVIVVALAKEMAKRDYEREKRIRSTPKRYGVHLYSEKTGIACGLAISTFYPTIEEAFLLNEDARIGCTTTSERVTCDKCKSTIPSPLR